ncbi:MAG: glycosyltransferase family 2 protein [Candidatus Saccharimonadales bacterium]
MANPLVSIVIVNWNGLDDTKLCLRHLKDQLYQNFEIIVVDNGSDDGSVDYLRKLKNIILVENPKNLGFTGGHIAGYKVTQGDFILLLNNDAIMDEHYLQKAVRQMTEDDKIGALGGRAYVWDEQNQLFDTTNNFYSYQNINPITGEGIFAKSDDGVPQEVNNVSGSCVIVRRSVIDKIGYLHNPFFAYFEESDLFARMKRAGYKVIYHPELAIWHANAKTSSRQAPTFFYYMIMRNRFRFAVRNFDGWSLRRFLKFYLAMGVVSMIKSVLPLKQRRMHQAYAKAFFYNLVFGWKAFAERAQLKRSLGKSDYNHSIVREQTGISVIVACSIKSEVNHFINFAQELKPWDELIIITPSGTLEDYLKKYTNLPSTMRLCVDRGYFNTHRSNLGAVCARNDWLLISGADRAVSTKGAFDYLSQHLYLIKRSGKKLACAVKEGTQLKSLKDVLDGEFSQELLINRNLFIDEGGLDKSLSLPNAKRQMLAYGSLSNSFLPVFTTEIESRLLPYSGDVGLTKLHKKLTAKIRQAKVDNQPLSALDKVANRYYRVAQLRNFLTWLFYWRIPWRLKLGRLNNLLVALVTFNLQGLATELKHMRNEVALYKNAIDMVAMKKREQERLGYLLNHPEETVVFIILRDRYDPLRQLLKWLNSQKLTKIVFIDNDSELPPLMDFLNRTGSQVLELRRNMTQTAPWSAGVIKVLLPDDFYVISDPDIIPATHGSDALKRLYDVHAKYPHHIKVGFGLKIDDLPDHYPLKTQVIEWESQFWKHPLEDGIYEAGVDTTFALYKPHTYRYLLHPSIRTGEPYVARHLPWYSDNRKLSDEEIFYRLRADQAVNSWDKEHLPERYKQELARKR